MIGCPHVTCLCLSSALGITAEDQQDDKIQFTCENGTRWEKPLGTSIRPEGEIKIVLDYNDDYSGEYYCLNKEGDHVSIYIKFRSKYHVS